MIARVLPESEWHRLDEQGDIPPLFAALLPKHTEVIVVEDGDRIVGRMMVMRLTHLEGAWIQQEHRNAGVVGSLLRQSIESSKEWSDKWVIGGAQDDRMRDILERLGGVKMPCEFYALGIGG